MMRSVRVGVGVVLGLVAIGGPLQVGAADDAPAVPSRSSRASSSAPSGGHAAAGGATSVQGLEAKLNEILEKQQQILTRLDEVMSELQIVKIRATVR